MANEYTQQEIDEILGRVATEMDDLGYVSKRTATDMKDMSAGVKNYTENLKNSFSRLGSSLGNLAGNMAKGATGAAQYTNLVGDAAEVLASVFTRLGPIGKGFGVALKAAGSGLGIVGSQSDAVYKSFQELSKSGMSTAGGMSTVFNNMQKLGYSVEELGNFNAIVGKNSETLSSFGATAGQGLAAFAGVANEIKNSQIGFEFRNMGMSVDDINTGIAGFLKMQTLNGSRATLTQQQLQEGSQKYIQELNLLSKLTGQSTEKLQQNREEMLSQERFAGLKYELQQRIDSNDKADSEVAKKQLEQINLTYEGLGKYGKEAQTGFINSLTGTVSEANAKFLRTMPEAFAASQQPVIDSNTILSAAARNAATYMDNFGAAAAKIGASGDFGLAVKDLMTGLAWSKMSFEERKAQADKDRVITDQSTTAMTTLIDAQKNTTIQIQAMANAAFKHVVPAFQAIADTALFVAKTAREALGVDMGGVKEFGSGPKLFEKPLPVVNLTPGSETDKFQGSKGAVALGKALRTNTPAQVDILRVDEQIKLNKDKLKSEQSKIDQSKSGRNAYFGQTEEGGRERSLKAIEQYKGRIERLEKKKQDLEKKQDLSGLPKSREFSGKITKGPDFNVNEYLTKLIKAESDGRNIGTEIKSEDGKPTSSAYGLTQITKETFDSLVARAKEGDALYQKTHEEMKQDTTLQREATKLLVSDNSRQLTAAGIKITNASQHLAHVIGGPTAINALKAKDDTKVTDVLSPDQLASNPQLAKLATIADLKEWSDKKIGGGGYKFGGVATGPDSGYDTTLHGTEAVVPLPDGRTIPVQMVGSDQQMGLMAAQLSRLDDIVRVMQNQLGVSQKILQYAQ